LYQGSIMYFARPSNQARPTTAVMIAGVSVSQLSGICNWHLRHEFRRRRVGTVSSHSRKATRPTHRGFRACASNVQISAAAGHHRTTAVGCKSLLGRIKVGPREEFGKRNILRRLQRPRDAFGSQRCQPSQQALSQIGIDAGDTWKAHLEV